jgi:hypothetical protein
MSFYRPEEFFTVDRVTMAAQASRLGYQPEKTLSERHALAVLEEFVGAQAERLQISLSVNAGVEISDRVSDVGFKQITVLRVAFVQIKGGDDFHDKFPAFVAIARCWCSA